MTAIHAQIGNAMVLFYALVGVWGIILAVRRTGVDPAYRGALVLAVGVAVVQVLVGGLLLLQGRPLRNDTHLLYGLSAVVTLPLVHQFLAGRYLSPPLAYGLGCLFMAGLVIRGIATAGG